MLQTIFDAAPMLKAKTSDMDKFEVKEIPITDVIDLDEIEAANKDKLAINGSTSKR